MSRKTSRARTLLAGLAIAVTASAGSILVAPAAHAAPVSGAAVQSGVVVKTAIEPSCPFNLDESGRQAPPYLEKNPWSPNIYVSRTQRCYEPWSGIYQGSVVTSTHLTAATWGRVFGYQAPRVTYRLIGPEFVEFANCARTAGTLSYGASGGCVRAFQYAINNFYRKQGIPTITTDGVFGAATQRGVIRIQAASGLFPTGVITATTRARLGRALTGEGDGSFTPAYGARFTGAE